MEDEVIPDITCNVCGENEFEQRDGFYYCFECGTKQEQVRHVEVENEDDNFNETTTTKHTKTIKINVAKAEKPQLTSWECYNYILRGYVEELLSFGAKEELKLMALQVWAAYLRRMEVAFFNKKQADLPKLGVRYLKNDAETIYNHTRQKRKRRRKSTNNETSCTSGEEMSAKSWRRSKRKLNESIYSSTTLNTTSTSVNSTKAIKLNFNTKARKYLKKKMPVKHLLRHEMDTEGLLQCHRQPRVVELKRLEYAVMVMNVRQIYTVLAIALNLIGDDIQLTDLVRFINEGRIGWKNILQYFPENIAANGPELLKKIDFYRYPEKYTEKAMRLHIALFSKHIGIKKFHTPDIVALVQRYVNELCLPQDIRVYAERLINFLPPRFEVRAASGYPPYEARAMAYIIFILKLLFGLDGHKEHRMSKAAKKLNRKIKELNRKNGQNRPLLFVWDEWQQYIEMRKVIVSRYSPAFCKQFNQCESTGQILRQMSDDLTKRDADEHMCTNKVEHPIKRQEMDSFKALFETFMENYKKTTENNPALNANVTQPQIEFTITYTPALSYFKTILLHHDNQMPLNSANENSLKIPHFMRSDHTQRDMHSYLEVKPLWEYFRNNRKELRVTSLETTENRNYLGIFRTLRQHIRYARQKACFDITNADWVNKTVNEMCVNNDDLDWNTEFEMFSDAHCKKNFIRNSIAPINIVDPNDRPSNGNPRNGSYTEIKPNTNLSIDIFSENNMDPLRTENGICEPRRNLGRFDIFADIEDEESLYNVGNETNSNQSEKNDTLPSRAPSPSAESTFSTADIYIKSEFLPESTNTEPDILKFYTSNMDCWMIFGNILMLTNSQLSQLQDKLPLGFFWLLETCAQTLGMDWPKVYEQLLVIEMMLCMGIEDVNEVSDCVYLKYTHPIKDYHKVISAHRDIW